jgi:hypothetical protein
MVSLASTTLHKISPPLSIHYHLSLLLLGTFLATWLYTVWKIPNTKSKKEFSKPYESRGKLNPPGA